MDDYNLNSIINSDEIKQEAIDIYEEFEENEAVLEALRAEQTCIKLEGIASDITFEEETRLEPSNEFESNAVLNTPKKVSIKRSSKRKAIKSRKNTSLCRENKKNTNELTGDAEVLNNKIQGADDALDNSKNLVSGVTRELRYPRRNIVYSFQNTHTRKKSFKENRKILKPCNPKQNNRNKYQCDKCKFVSPHAKKLQKHKQKYHKNFKCTVCSFQSNRQETYENHIFRHDFEGPYICDLCSMDFKQRGKLQRHIRSHEKVRKYKCPDCPLSFAENSNLSAHSITHVDIYPYRCLLCSFATKYKSSLSEHIDTHSKYRTYQCELCSFKAKTRGGLKSHTNTHLNRYFACSECPYKVKKKDHLTRHFRLNHYKAPLLSCEECSFTTYDKESMDNHAAIHRGFFPCIICFTIFKKKLTLNIHLERHKLLKDLQCSACTMKECCSEHKYYDLNVFQCDVCSKIHHKKTALEEHILKYHS